MSLLQIISLMIMVIQLLQLKNILMDRLKQLQMHTTMKIYPFGY